MNRETACAIVRDLMPMHIEGMTEPETDAFVERHLAECEACRGVKRNMLHVILPEEQAQSEFLEALRRARIRRKRRIMVGIAAFLLIAAICILPFPRRVNMDVQAVRWQAGNAEAGSDSVQVRLSGVYADYIFRTDRFSGNIAIEGVEITHVPESMLAVRMDSPGALIYREADGRLQYVGFVVASPGMREFVIGLYGDGEGQGGWSGDDGTVLTWPAVSRQDAVETTRRIAIEQDCTWLSEGIWEAGASGD